MNKVKLLNCFMSVFLLMIATLALPENAIADYASSCQSCHGSLASSSKKGASASKIQSAINNNTGGMGSLSTLAPAQVDAIAVQLGSASTCVAPKKWDTTGKVCAVPTPTPVVCTPPAVRDSATNTCKVPACPTGQVRNTAGVCVTPAPSPVVCTPPAVRDAATNTCKVPPCPIGQVRNTAGVCVTPAPTPVVCTPPALRDTATNACVTPSCPTGQTRNTQGVCATPPAVTSVSGSVGLAKSGEARTDVYKVTCATGTTSLYVRVKDLAPVKAPLISIQATKGMYSSALGTDSVDGDANYSPWGKLAKGPGDYMMKVNKSAAQVACNKVVDDEDEDEDEDDHDSDKKCYVAGPETYVAQFACRNAAGIKTGTKWKIKQNQ